MTYFMLPLSTRLNDGTAVTLRAIQPTDAALLRAGFERLSPQSIYLRFLNTRHELTEAEARALATVDGERRMAVVAELENAEGVWVVGVARYTVLPNTHPLEAEVAVIVGDPYQRQGLGRCLLQALALYAQAHGVRYWVGEVSPVNQALLAFLERAELSVEKHLKNGLWQIRVDLEAGRVLV
jgi:RimJ/RimL family protein N-acetyltransferase